MVEKKRYYFMYTNAIISSFAVVVLHTVANPDSFGIKTDHFSFYPVLFILIGILFSFGVPIFFMQSGANVLTYRERYSTKTFVKKRIHKVVIPFLLWSILGFIFLHNNQLGSINGLNFLKGFISGNIVGPYWFFYNIIGFYLCVPFMSIITEKGNARVVRYMIIIALIYNTILPIVDLMLGTSNMFNPSIPLVGAYLQYFLAGWYIVNISIKPRIRKLIYILATIMLALEIVMTIIFTIFIPHLQRLTYPGEIVKNFADIGNLPAFICMCALFLALKNAEPYIIGWHLSSYLPTLAGLTFGIYLVHPFVINYLLNPMQPLLLQVPLIFKILLYPIFVYFISGIITFLIRKIPFVRNIMP